MATEILPGQTTWSCTRDEEGHREYRIRHRVKGLTTDGPAAALATPGLPLPGSNWAFDGDVDLWATCRWDATVTPVVTGEPGRFFDVEQRFSTKPPDNKTCVDQQVENPLLEPMKISGTFVKYLEEAYEDRFGFPILNSAFEQMRGPQVEFDRNRPSVRIEQNVANLQLALCSSMVDTLNGIPLWGFPKRCIKLSNFTWERKFYGQCLVYYTRIFEFDVNYETFDRSLLDSATKVIRGRWGNVANGDPTSGWQTIPVANDLSTPDPNPNNPTHFMRAEDPNGNPIQVILNGRGFPIDVPRWGREEPTNPTTTSTAAYPGNVQSWSDADGLEGDDDNTYASAGSNASGPTNYLISTVFGFEKIPDAAVILSLIASFDAIAEGEVNDLSAVFVYSGGDVADVPVLAVPWSEIEHRRTYSLIGAREFAAGGYTAGNGTGVIPALSGTDAKNAALGFKIAVNIQAGAVAYAKNLTIEVVYVVPSAEPGRRFVQKYNESNLLLLGIPANI